MFALIWRSMGVKMEWFLVLVVLVLVVAFTFF